MSIAFVEREKVIREFIFVYDEWVIKYLNVSTPTLGKTRFSLTTYEVLQLDYNLEADRLYFILSVDGINKRHDLYQFAPSSRLCSDWTDRLQKSLVELAEKVNEFKKNQNSNITHDLKVY
jgi:hypothetical protein